MNHGWGVLTYNFPQIIIVWDVSEETARSFFRHSKEAVELVRQISLADGSYETVECRDAEGF